MGSEPKTFTVGAEAQAGPQQRAIGSLTQRFGAAVLDSLIAFPLMLIALIPGRLAQGEFTLESGLLLTPSGDSTSGELLFYAFESTVLAVVWVLYAGLLTARRGERRGQTFGKQVLDLRIVTRAGGEISRATAWNRVVIATLITTAPGIAGILVDAVAGTAPTGTNVGLALSTLASSALILAALQGDERRGLHDRLAGTVVVTSGEGEQPLPRPVTTTTWVLGGLLAVATVVSGASFVATNSGLLDDALYGDQERAEVILREPATRQAHADLAALERAAAACLQKSEAVVCESKLPEQLEQLTFNFDTFDLEQDPVGAHAGTVAVLADDGDLLLYVFTRRDRTWVGAVSKGGKVDPAARVCVPRDGNFCEGILLWPGWND